MDDHELLLRYARDRDENAFTELVRRHLDFVYSAALRQVGGDAHFAEDVTQTVFADLARHAARLTEHPVLNGWLFTSARFAASKLVRRERLRQAREQKAHVMQEIEIAGSTQWEQVRPLLDEALAELKEADRHAVLLRFFEDQGYAAVGARLRLSEDAARMRVERALEQLRRGLARRGIASTPVALAAMLSAQSSIAAPAGLLTSVATTAMADAAAAGPVALALTHLMGIKTTLGVAASLALAGLVCAPAVGLALHQTNAARRAATAVTIAQREQHARIQQLQALQNDTTHMAAQASDIQHAVARAQAALTSASQASASTKPGDPRADGARFLAAFPQARAMLIEAGKTRTSPVLLDIFRRAGLTPAQVDELNTRFWANRADSLTLRPDNMGWSVSGAPPDQEMRQLLGEAGFREFKEYERMAPAHDAAAEIASQIAFEATPLATAQIDQLTRAMWQLKPPGNLAPDTPEWDSTMAPLRGLMSAEQWRVAEGAIAGVIFPRLLDLAQRNAAKAAAAGTSK